MAIVPLRTPLKPILGTAQDRAASGGAGLPSGGAPVTSNPPTPVGKPTPPKQSPVFGPKPAPAIGGKGKGGKGGKGGGKPGGFNPSTSSFGLNLKDKGKFDLYGSPETMGQFNQEVLKLAQPQYLPQLQDIRGEQSAEASANAQRRGDIGSIYSQYNTQAQQAFKETQDALNKLVLSGTYGDAASQANLAAALQSASGGQGSLASMMGISTPQGGALPYEGAAQGVANVAQDELKGLAAGAIGMQGNNIANVGRERATQQNTEGLRHRASIQGLQQERHALIQQIPGIIEKARENLITQLENAQALKFQQDLATKQFDLASQAQSFNQDLATKQFNETKLNDASNRNAQAAQIAQNAAAIGNQRNNTNAAAAQAIARAKGQQQVNGIKYLTSWLMPTKQELTNKSTTDANGNRSSTTVLSNPKAWHRDVGQALKTLMNVYGMDLDTALGIMSSVGGSTYVSGQGGQTVAQWANTYKQRAASQGVGNVGAGIGSGVGTGIGFTS